MKTRYYAIAGVNGYGVYDDYDKVLSQRKFLAEFKIKRCQTFDIAKGWAEEMFYEFQDDITIVQNINIINRMNWTYFRIK